MDKIMTLELLSSIKGAKPSPDVNELFTIIKGAVPVKEEKEDREDNHDKIVSLEEVRDDVVIESSGIEKKVIIENFPVCKNNYLVVAKVIEGL